jgi:hypothetical protein
MVEAIETGTKMCINSLGIILVVNQRIKEKHAKFQEDVMNKQL